MATKWLKYIAIFVSTTIVVIAAGVLITQKVSDGPIEFLQGGSFTSGELVDTQITDWSFAEGKRTEFELVGFGTSRVAGFIVHEGVAYMTCDLGFMWNRFDEGMQKWLLRLIYTFKRWHKDAVEDGRALLRIENKLYKTQFVKVDDPELDRVLRSELENMARKYFDTDFGPPPDTEPNDIWFFRMDPRK